MSKIILYHRLFIDIWIPEFIHVDHAKVYVRSTLIRFKLCLRGQYSLRSVGSAGASVLRSCIAAIVASRRGRDPAGEECRGTPKDTARIESDKGDKGASHLARAGLEPSFSLPTTVCVSRASSMSSS